MSRINGLSQNTVNSIIQDNDGFLWIATYNGVNKYDGYSMDYYDLSNRNLSSNLIHNLFKDNDGNIWAGTPESGINRINPNTKKTVTFFNNSIDLGNFRSNPNTVFQLHQSASGVYFYLSKKKVIISLESQKKILLSIMKKILPGSRVAVQLTWLSLQKTENIGFLILPKVLS